jgi:hypothetical protein
MSPFQWCLHQCSVHHAFVTISSAIYVGNEKMMLLHCWWRLFWHCIVHYRYYWRWRTVSMGLLTGRWQLLLLAMNRRRMMSSLIGLWWLPIVWELSMICISFSCFSFFAFKRVPRPSRDLTSPLELKYAVNRKTILIKCYRGSLCRRLICSTQKITNFVLRIVYTNFEKTRFFCG